MTSDQVDKCSACGEELGEPEDEIARPDEDDPPEDAHFEVQQRKDGEKRAQCTKSGKLASVVSGNKTVNPINGKVTGRVSEGGEDDRKRGSDGGKGKRFSADSDGGSGVHPSVYDFPEEQSQLDVLMEVVTNPTYGLEDEQVREIKDWATDYDGRLPPDVLEDIAANMSGIQKQTAALCKQRYEVKLNKWISEKSNREKGPPIGSLQNPSNKPGSRRRRQQSQQKPPKGEKTKPPKGDKEDKEKNEKDKKKKQKEQQETPAQKVRRRKRINRRNMMMDAAAEEIARETAPQVAQELTSNLGTYFGLPAKIIETKIEKDPEWAMELVDRIDVDIIDLLEPSEKRKEEMDSGGPSDQHSVDKELEDALKAMSDGSGETTEESSQGMSAAPTEEDIYEEEEDNSNTENPDQSFEEIFNETTESDKSEVSQ